MVVEKEKENLSCCLQHTPHPQSTTQQQHQPPPPPPPLLPPLPPLPLPPPPLHLLPIQQHLLNSRPRNQNCNNCFLILVRNHFPAFSARPVTCCTPRARKKTKRHIVCFTDNIYNQYYCDPIKKTRAVGAMKVAIVVSCNFHSPVPITLGGRTHCVKEWHDNWKV